MEADRGWQPIFVAALSTVAGDDRFPDGDGFLHDHRLRSKKKNRLVASFFSS
jgi:hypothetical protein